MSLAKRVLNKNEAVSSDMVLNLYDKTFKDMRKMVDVMEKDYKTKFERRVKSDYAGKDDKLKKIGSDVMNITKRLDAAIANLKSTVG